MRRPNVIIIIADALRAQNLTIYGYPKQTSPVLSKIAREGVVFQNAYAATDQTDPSFTTILSGRYPLVHGILRHGSDLKPRDISTFHATGTKLLPEFLAQEGYTTVAIDWLGRWHKNGYKIYGAASSFKPKRLLGHSRKARVLATRILARSPNWKVYKLLYKILSATGYFNDLSSITTFEVACRLFKELKESRPFFMLLHLWDTHTPFHDIPHFLVKQFYDRTCRETVQDMAQRIKNPKWRHVTLHYHLRGIKCVDEIEPRYNASIRHFDTTLHELMEALREAGFYDESIILITGDHGENLVRNGIFIGHGGLFQRVLKIPLILIGPQIPSQKTVNVPVQHVDIMPTLLRLTGIELPAKYYVDGTNLLNVVETGESPRPYVFAVSSTAPKRYAFINGRYKLVYSPSKADALDKYGGIWFQEVIELYDLALDDDDQKNLAQSDPGLVEEMIGKLNYLVKSLQKTRIKLIVKSRTRRIATK